jgi:hypothetical protein
MSDLPFLPSACSLTHLVLLVVIATVRDWAASARFAVSEFVMSVGGVPAGLVNILGAGGSGVESRILARVCSQRKFMCELSGGSDRGTQEGRSFAEAQRKARRGAAGFIALAAAARMQALSGFPCLWSCCKPLMMVQAKCKAPLDLGPSPLTK